MRSLVMPAFLARGHLLKEKKLLSGASLLTCRKHESRDQSHNTRRNSSPEEVLGEARRLPLSTPDFSAYLLQSSVLGSPFCAV